MKENDIPLKKPYLPPKLITVAFKVEDAFTSGGPRLLEFLTPDPSSGGGGLRGYSHAANENSFFDPDLSTSSGTKPYDNFTWSW